MTHRSWGSGWPNCQRSTMITFRAGGRSWTTRQEVAPIFRRFIDEIVRRGYRISDGQLDDWSFCCRAIAGTNTPSNHSYGLAVDINSLANPMTFNGRLVTNVPRWVVESATFHGLTWGGNYSGLKKDPMHFEWTRSVYDAELKVLQLAAIDAGHGGVDPVPDDELSLTMSQYTDLKAVVDAIRSDVWYVAANVNETRADLLRLHARVMEIEKSIHGSDDTNRDGSIYWNTAYLRGELLGDPTKIRRILDRYGREMQPVNASAEAEAEAKGT